MSQSPKPVHKELMVIKSMTSMSCVDKPRQKSLSCLYF